MAPRPREKRTAAGGKSPDLDWEAFTRVCEELARSGAKYVSCERLGFNYTIVNAAIREAEARGDDTWRELWDVAQDRYRESLALEATRRARDGVLTPRFGKDGKVGTERVYSDRLMEVMLKGYFPERFRENVYHSGTIGLEPVDAFANLSSKAKRLIRQIIMDDLAEQREAEAQRRNEGAGLIEGVAVPFTPAAALEDMRGVDAAETGEPGSWIHD